MSLRTKKILLSVVSFALTLCVAFAVTSYLINGLKPAYAEEAEKTVVEWAVQGSASGKDFVDNGDGTITVTNSYAAVQQIKGDAYNAYNNIVKKTIVITNLVKQGVSGNHGVSIGIYNGSNSAYGANKYAWTNPRVNIFDSCIQINNGWGDGSSQSYSDNVFAYSYKGEPCTLQNNVPYTIYFGIENVDVEGELYVEIYAKLTDVTGQITYVEQTHTLKAMNTLPKDFKDQMNVRVRTGARSYTESTDPYYVKEFNVSTAKTYTLDALEHDEDISYYWLSDYVTDNKVGKEATAASCTTLTKDSQFYTPDFDNRWTFKLVVDNTYGFFSAEKFTTKSGSSYDAGALRIGLGQRYSDIGFKFDYYRDKIILSCANSTLGSKSFNFELDPTKEYKVSIVVRDVRDEQGTLVYRMPVVDVVEIGNETHKITASLLIDFLVTYGDKDGDYLPKHMRLCNGNDHNSLSGSNLYDTSDGCGFSLVSLEPWKYVTIGNETHKINTADITLPDGAIGYVCSADSKLYAPGKADLRAYTGKEITFVPVAIDSMPTVLNFTDMSFVDVKLRFKLEVANEIVEALENYAIIDFVVKKGDEVVQCEQGFDAGDGTTIMTLTTGVLDASDYETVFVASATITIEYANCDAQTIQLPGTCSNSASHIANYALENPAEFGVEAWNEAYVAEFERILAGGAQ